MSEDRNLVANFSPNSYEVSVSIQPSGTAVVEGGGTYLLGKLYNFRFPLFKRATNSQNGPVTFQGSLIH